MSNSTALFPDRRRSLLLLAVPLVAIALIALVALRPPDRAASAGVGESMRFGLAYGNELAWKSDAEIRDSLDTARIAGAQWIRIDLDWSLIEPSPASWQWSRYDRIVELASARQLQVIAVLAYAPRWAAIPTCATRTCGPAQTQSYQRFVQAAVDRYAPRGVHTWEVWNEPNLRLFWGDAPDPDAYADLLRAASETIRRLDPGGTVLFGGLAVADSGVDAMDQLSFLNRVVALTPLSAVDAISYHPYTFPDTPDAWHPWPTSWQAMGGPGTMRWSGWPGKTLRSALSELGHPTMRIWVTEYGAPTGGPGGAYDGGPRLLLGRFDHVSEHQQARLAADAFRLSCGDSSIAAFVWYSERDRSAQRDDTENFFGLRRADGIPKPALYALRDAQVRHHGTRNLGAGVTDSAC